MTHGAAKKKKRKETGVLTHQHLGEYQAHVSILCGNYYYQHNAWHIASIAIIHHDYYYPEVMILATGLMLESGNLQGIFWLPGSHTLRAP